MPSFYRFIKNKDNNSSYFFLIDSKEFQITLNPGEQTIVLYKYEPIQAFNFSYKSTVNTQLEEVKVSQVNFMNLEEFYKSNDMFFSEIAVQVDNDKRNRIIQLVKEQGNIAQRIWEDKVTLQNKLKLFSNVISFRK